jgi:hypothetical protein
MYLGMRFSNVNWLLEGMNQLDEFDISATVLQSMSSEQ